jgi:hypothetical protein
MKYDEAKIVDLSEAVTAIHGGQQKIPCNCIESKAAPFLMTLPAYVADK